MTDGATNKHTHCPCNQFPELNMSNPSAELSVTFRNEEKVLLDFLIVSALQASSWWVSTYRMNHTVVNDEVRGRLAIARLEWTIDKGRESLSGQLTAEEFEVVCSAFYLEIIAPSDMERIEWTVADTYGLNLSNYENNPSAAQLINKLKTLSPNERLALLDLVEMFWHGPRDKNGSVEDFMLSFEVRPAKS